MIELSSAGETGEKVPLNLHNLEGDQSYLKRKRLYIIIGGVAILVVILIVLLVVLIPGSSDKDKDKDKDIQPSSDEDRGDDIIDIKNNINLEVY